MATSTPAPRGTVALEEAVLDPSGLPWMAKSAVFFAPSAAAAGLDAFAAHPMVQALQDIHGKRLQQMDAHGVEFMLLSLTSWGPQGEPDPEKSAEIARTANDWLAAEVAKNPGRFGALASLPMARPEVAAEELRRAVEVLGMRGAIVNDYQEVYEDFDVDGDGGGEGRTGERPDGAPTKRLYYDHPRYDVFWRTLQELDLPVYLHPRYPPAVELEPGQKYDAAKKHLVGASVQFHLDLSYHVYAIASSGVLDRFPKVKIVIGHLGEGIPFNLWRADHWLNKPIKKKMRPCKEDYRYYLTHNIFITTSGNFNTRALKFCIDELGLDRCLFSIDYPYDTVEDAQEWWKTLDLPGDQKEAIARSNAIKLFKLPLEL